MKQKKEKVLLHAAHATDVHRHQERLCSDEPKSAAPLQRLESVGQL
jgi:hypothetical protein